MSSKEEIAEIAKRHGCDVGFDKCGFPYCKCPDGRHMCDQQCSLISLESAKRVRLRLVVSR